MKIFNTSQFTYFPESRSFVAEASDLRDFTEECFPSFMLCSQWTGAAQEARHFHTQTDSERDVLSWNFSIPEANCTVVIFND